MDLTAYLGSGLESLRLTENIFLVDILDIAIIAFLIYLGIFFLKQTRSLVTFIGIISSVLIYFIARTFSLHLTAIVLQSFFGALLIILVIVFQDELRRFFQLLAVVGTRQNIKRKKTQISSPMVSSIVQAVLNLAREKRGALIIIPGQEMIERYLEGGEELDGMVSSSILESIFDPDSSGHDGAVVIEKSRILKFGAHLPLSKNFKQIKGRGTRHSAAIGISEKSDALAIVVSEERGEISIAKNGRLKTLKDSESLEKQIGDFLKEKFPEQPTSFFENLVKKNTFEKASAVLIAFFLWFFIVFQVEIIQRDFVVPISYRGIPEKMIIKDTQPGEVVVTLSGRGQAAFSRLDDDSLSIVLDREEIEEGTNYVEIERSHLRHPFDTSIINIAPSVVQITAQEFEKHTLLLQPETENLSENLKVVLNPDSITILVPKDEDPPLILKTELIDAAGVEKEKTIEIKVEIPPSLQLPKGTSREITATFKLKDND